MLGREARSALLFHLGEARSHRGPCVPTPTSPFVEEIARQLDSAQRPREKGRMRNFPPTRPSLLLPSLAEGVDHDRVYELRLSASGTPASSSIPRCEVSCSSIVTTSADRRVQEPLRRSGAASPSSRATWCAGIVLAVDVVVVVLPVLGAGVVWRIDVDAVDLASWVTATLEGVVVLAVDHRVERACPRRLLEFSA